MRAFAMVTLFVVNPSVDTSLRNCNITEVILDGFFRSLERRQERWVIIQALSTVDWLGGSERRSGILKKAAFLAFTICL